MNYFNRNKWLTIGFLLLISLNMATLLTFWLMRTKDRRPPPSAHTDFLVKELGLDSNQQQQLQQLREEHQQQVKDIRSHNRDAKDAFFALLKENDLPDSALQNAAIRSVEYDKQLDIITFRHFQQIRNICTPEQKIKFDDIIRDVVHLNAPPPERLPGNGPEGPPPGDRPPPPR